MTVFFPFSIGYFLLFVSWIPSCDGMTEEVAFCSVSWFPLLDRFPNNDIFLPLFFRDILFYKNLPTGCGIDSSKIHQAGISGRQRNGF